MYTVQIQLTRNLCETGYLNFCLLCTCIACLVSDRWRKPNVCCTFNPRKPSVVMMVIMRVLQCHGMSVDCDLIALWHRSANPRPLTSGKIKLVGFPYEVI